MVKIAIKTAQQYEFASHLCIGKTTRLNLLCDFTYADSEPTSTTSNLHNAMHECTRSNRPTGSRYINKETMVFRMTMGLFSLSQSLTSLIRKKHVPLLSPYSFLQTGKNKMHCVFMLNWLNWFTGWRGLNERRSCLRETEPSSVFVFGFHVPSPPSQRGIRPIGALQAVGQDPHQQSCWIINAALQSKSGNKPGELYTTLQQGQLDIPQSNLVCILSND